MRSSRDYSPGALTRWIRQLIAADDLHRFYISKRWLALRAEVLNEQHHECQLCKDKGQYSPAVTVHHKQPVRRAPWLALDKSNLMAVCEACHYDLHHRAATKWQDERW